MFETTKVIIKDNSRNLVSKMKQSPVLYIFFTVTLIGSIGVFAFTAYFLLKIKTDIDITLDDVFFTVFFVFLLKSSADFYKHFIDASQVSYSLSTRVNQLKTIFQIFLSIFLIQMIIWFSLSLLFMFFLGLFRINIWYPTDYLTFTVALTSSIFLGCCVAAHYFSAKKYRIIPMVILLLFILYSNSMLFVLLTTPLALIHLIWTLKNAKESYHFTNHKKRKKSKSTAKLNSAIKALFHRETTVLWRDNLFFSFVFTAVIAGLGSGYLFLNGNEIFIPEQFQDRIGDFLPSMFIIMGVFVVTIYTAVFTSLNLFLNEEKTMWLIKNIPVENKTLIYGKTSSLILCFISSIPFIPYMLAFVGLDQTVYLTWLLIFAFILGVIISVPLGVKYVGKKSDIMLFYSIAMLFFVILIIAAFAGDLIRQTFDYAIGLYAIIIFFELFVLWGSLKISSHILSKATIS